MTTVSQVCEGALRLFGIRDFTDTDRQAEAIAALNSMLTSWRLDLHHSLITQSFSLVAGTSSYTIGAGGVINSARPIKIISAYIRDSSGLDYPLDTKLSKEDYNLIDDKDIPGRPEKLYYEKANPLGIIYFDSAPSEVETCYISSLKPYDEYVTLADVFLLPIEYEEAVKHNLAVRLAPEYFMEVSSTVVALAIQLKDEISNENMEPTPISEIPVELLR
jgi:hypothetical protein